MSAELTVAEEAGVNFAEGQPDRQLMRSAGDADLVVEACAAGGVDSALLYAQNLTGGFFDLSSGEAAEELRGGWFGVFESRESAVEWLRRKP
jgi:hypothetical protein